MVTWAIWHYLIGAVTWATWHHSIGKHTVGMDCLLPGIRHPITTDYLFMGIRHFVIMIIPLGARRTQYGLPYLGCVADEVVVTWVVANKHFSQQSHQNDPIVCCYRQLSVVPLQCVRPAEDRQSMTPREGLTPRHWSSLANRHNPT